MAALSFSVTAQINSRLKGKTTANIVVQYLYVVNAIMAPVLMICFEDTNLR